MKSGSSFTFVAICNNSHQTDAPESFSYEELDVTWTSVRTQLLGQSHIIPYIFNFLSSKTWNGTVNYTRKTTRVGPANKVYTFKMYLPTVNNTLIPGPKRQCWF